MTSYQQSVLSVADEVKTFPSIAQKIAAEVISPRLLKELPAKKSSDNSLAKFAGEVLPGILKTSKPPIGDTRVHTESETYVGFNPSNLKLDVKDKLESSPRAKRDDDTPPAPTTFHLPQVSLLDMNVRCFIPEAQPKFNHSETMKKLKYKNDPTLDELRRYVALMDKFTLDNFMIYEGRALRETPEFQVYEKKFINEWGSISALILQLEELMKKYEVKLAIVNGIKLFELASLHLPNNSREEILDCISNIEQIRPLIMSKNMSPAYQQIDSAIKIQALGRRYVTRKMFLKRINRLKSCIKIQSQVRLMLHRQRHRGIYRTHMGILEDHFKENRAKLEEFWSSDVSGPGHLQRLLIHIPSITASEFMRLDMENLRAVQNSLVSSLYQLADPNVRIIYVSPVHMSGTDLAYHDRCLAMMGISTLPKRLTFIVPELTDVLPQHLTISQLLWCSSKALKKIRLQIRQSPLSIIIPGSVGWAERRIANFLNVPILSPDPTIAETLSLRSFSKKVFMEASVNIPMGAHDIHNTEDFLIALSRLMTSNMDVRRWIFRLNSDFNSNSVVYLDCDKLSLMSTLRAEMEILIQMNSNNAASWFTRPVQLTARKRLMIALRTEIASLVHICNKNLFPTWEAFLKKIKTVGAVIEAAPVEPLGYVDALCFIDPLGGIQVAGGLDVLVDKHYQTQAYIWPQTVTPHVALQGAASAVAAAMYHKWNVIGYVTVRFLALWDAYDNIPRIWAQSLHFGLTASFACLGAVAVACSPGVKLAKSLVPAMPEGKSFVHVPVAVHAPLRDTRDDVFFKFCKMRGVAYDIEARTGTIFFLVDSIVGGVLSLVSIGNTRQKATQHAAHAVNFVTQQFGREMVEGHRPWDNLSSILFRLQKSIKRDEKHAKQPLGGTKSAKETPA